jgi:hypothetical protein
MSLIPRFVVDFTNFTPLDYFGVSNANYEERLAAYVNNMKYKGICFPKIFSYTRTLFIQIRMRSLRIIPDR